MNHCIRACGKLTLRSSLIEFAAVLDLIQVHKDGIAFIVMEEWAPQHVAGTPCNLRIFLGALRQCLEVSSPFSHHKSV